MRVLRSSIDNFVPDTKFKCKGDYKGISFTANKTVSDVVDFLSIELDGPGLSDVVEVVYDINRPVEIRLFLEHKTSISYIEELNKILSIALDLSKNILQISDTFTWSKITNIEE